MGLRAKFNVLMLLVSVLGVGMFTLAANSLVNSVARDDVLQSSRIMMESAAGARKYTSEQIAPVLKPLIAHQFYPQSVSAYAAKRNFDVIRSKFPDYMYREAALNPTNPQDRASDWEADIINDFRAHPGREEISVERSTPTGPMLELARPLVNKPACLECHDTATDAPASMIALYGSQNGFGWKAGEVIGAQIVSVPMTESSLRAAQIRKLFVTPFLIFLVVLFAAVNLLLHFIVIHPIERMAGAAEAVSMGKIDTPEYHHGGSDQVGRLAASFNRMHRSLAEALRMLGED
jgi:HAMP domain-containing protein